MTLPAFLSIGTQGTGTTWLHRSLASHPDVYVPTRRKEVHFFDRSYDLGIQWYEKFFPSDAPAGKYKAVGVITPACLFCAHCLERIASIPSLTKLILMLNDPIDRVYSNYSLRVKQRNYSGTFETSLAHHPGMIEWGFYSHGIGNYFRYFRGDQVLVLIYEHAMVDVPKIKDTLARFLDIALNRFPLNAGARRTHKSYLPKARSAYVYLLMCTGSFVIWIWLDRVVNLAKELGIERLFGESSSLSPMKEETRKCLAEVCREEIGKLESLLEIGLECWK